MEENLGSLGPPPNEQIPSRGTAGIWEKIRARSLTCIYLDTGPKVPVLEGHQSLVESLTDRKLHLT
jgi:hypothetical protein